jgi:hypothetical protein
MLLHNASSSRHHENALFLQVFYVQAVHQKVRRQCVEFIQKNKCKFQEVIDFELYYSYVIDFMLSQVMTSGWHERGRKLRGVSMTFCLSIISRRKGSRSIVMAGTHNH